MITVGNAKTPGAGKLPGASRPGVFTGLRRRSRPGRRESTTCVSVPASWGGHAAPRREGSAASRRCPACGAFVLSQSAMRVCAPHSGVSTDQCPWGRRLMRGPPSPAAPGDVSPGLRPLRTSWCRVGALHRGPSHRTDLAVGIGSSRRNYRVLTEPTTGPLQGADRPRGFRMPGGTDRGRCLSFCR